MKIPSESPFSTEKALELTMRDVLHGLNDAACRLAYSEGSLNFEILSTETVKVISPPEHSKALARVHPVLQARSRDVVEFLMRRESQEFKRTGS